MGHGIWNEGALKVKEPEAPFMSCAVFNHQTNEIQLMNIERWKKNWYEIRYNITDFPKIQNQDEACDILLDVTGRTDMVEKIKAEIKKVNMANLTLWHRTGNRAYKNYAESLANILHFITDLEAKKE